MNEGVIESNILLIAGGMERDPYLSENEIIKTYIEAGFNMGDVTLLLAAAKLLTSDRKNARTTKAVFRRVT